MFHGMCAGSGVFVCMCSGTQMSAGKVLQAVQCGYPTIVQHVEGPGPLARVCRGHCLVEDGAREPLHGISVVCLSCLMQPCIHVYYWMVVFGATLVFPWLPTGSSHHVT